MKASGFRRGIPVAFRRSLPVVAFLVSASCSRILSSIPGASGSGAGAKISSARELISEMHDRYAGNWYRTLQFTQTNTFYTQSGGEQKSRWVQTLAVPGRLRIDFEPLSSRSGLLIVDNRVTTFDNGKRVDSRRSIQPLVTLTADVYSIPPAVTSRRLDSLNIDLDKFRTDRLRRTRVYVIGAEEGDLESNQVWIDAERMLLVRLIQAERRGGRTVVTDTRIGGYREVDGFPIPHELVAVRDGKPYFREQYENVRVNAQLPPGIFEASRWASVRPKAG